MEGQTFNPIEARKAQAEYCEKTKEPHFAPYSGKCYSCNTNIYEQKEQSYKDRKWLTGISVEEASKSLVTGCPHCNRSYCD